MVLLKHRTPHHQYLWNTEHHQCLLFETQNTTSFLGVLGVLRVSNVFFFNGASSFKEKLFGVVLCFRKKKLSLEKPQEPVGSFLKQEEERRSSERNTRTKQQGWRTPSGSSANSTSSWTNHSCGAVLKHTERESSCSRKRRTALLFFLWNTEEPQEPLCCFKRRRFVWGERNTKQKHTAFVSEDQVFFYSRRPGLFQPGTKKKTTLLVVACPKQILLVVRLISHYVITAPMDL